MLEESIFPSLVEEVFIGQKKGDLQPIQLSYRLNGKNFP